MSARRRRTDDDRHTAALRARGKWLTQPRRIILDTERASDGHPSAAAVCRFDGNTEPHDHFTCLACSRIHDVRAAGAPGVRARVAARTGFEVLTHRIEF